MFELSQQGTEQGQRLAFAGSLTIYEVSQAHAALSQALVALQCTQWEADLAQLEELDSAGAQLLLAFQRHAQERGATLTVCNPTPAVLELLELLHLSALYPDVMPATRTGA